ncbi:MAG: hypothetical protein CSA70_06250 [Rhodobacterales bacterium]|nr:MAG: hypothetical protein CSA70_06250 [Rhodobacterales bacterium]
MRPFLSALAGLFAFAACTHFETTSDLANARVATAGAHCSGPSAPLCRFVNGPVQLDRSRPTRIPARPLVFYPTAEPLTFVDTHNRGWRAPVQTLTDGASIPRVFHSIIGNPTSREFVNAATIHDAYCGIGNESLPTFHATTWQEVHRMFYDALRVGGTPETKAKVMFAAVYLGGPRWGGQVTDFSDAPPDRMRDVLVEAIDFIRENNPTIEEIEAFLDAHDPKGLDVYVEHYGESGIPGPAGGTPGTDGTPGTGTPETGAPGTGTPGGNTDL